MREYYDYSGMSGDTNELLLEVYRLNAIVASVHLLHAADRKAAELFQHDMDYWMEKRLALKEAIHDAEDGKTTIKMTIPLEEFEGISC